MSETDLHSIPWLHVYAQSRQHSPAKIRGTTEGLKALRDALNTAIEHGGKATGEAQTSPVYAWDGEGYVVEIQRVNVIDLLGSLPYSGKETP